MRGLRMFFTRSSLCLFRRISLPPLQRVPTHFVCVR